MAEWIIAVSALVTALADTAAWIHHHHKDGARFAAHAARLDELENGTSSPSEH